MFNTWLRDRQHKISKAQTKLYYEFNEQNDIQQTFKSAMSIWTEDYPSN